MFPLLDGSSLCQVDIKLVSTMSQRKNRNKKMYLVRAEEGRHFQKKLESKDLVTVEGLAARR